MEPRPRRAAPRLRARGTGDLLDAAVAVLPEVSAFAEAMPEGRSAPRCPGRPANVGKSSLLNKLAGAEHVVVDPTAGTTRDPLDELIQLRGKSWRFVDTAGIRRRVQQASGADFYASSRTQAAIDKVEVAVVLVDARVKMTEQDRDDGRAVSSTGANSELSSGHGSRADARGDRGY